MPSVKELTSYMERPTEDGIALITKAYTFASKAHAGLKRYSGEPFFNHVYYTACKLAELGMGPKTISAGLLHDVVEDTDVTEDDIKKEFGDEILMLVAGVTKLGGLRYHGLKHHTESLRKLFVAIAQDIRVLIIKLADRLHNMQTLQYVPKEKQKRIAEETLEIYAPLAYRLGMRALNRELQDLAFPYVYPKEHAHVIELLKAKDKETTRHLQRVHRTLKRALAQEGIENTAHYRMKSIYALYLKLMRKDMDINKIYDTSALRVVVKNVSDCYRVLGIVHNLWRPLPGRIKDYIAFQKPNGYRSIHTTIFTGDGGIVEIQIRTEDMHRESEFGIASHIQYKYALDKKTSPSTLAWIVSFIPYFNWRISTDQQHEKAPKELKQDTILATVTPQWVRDLAEGQAEVSDPQEFLARLKVDFFGERVFIFTPKGEVVDLPVGSSPVDFAYSIHTDLGHHLAGAKVNGKLVSLNTALNNGDIVEIQTSRNAKPSQKWLDYVKTDLARRKIRSLLQKESGKKIQK